MISNSGARWRKGLPEVLAHDPKGCQAERLNCNRQLKHSMSGCECKPDAKRKRDSAQHQERAQPSSKGGRMMNRAYLVAAFLFVAVALSVPAIPVAAQSGAFVPVTPAMQANPDPADWLHISRTYNQHRFSPLDQINKGNVSQLRMAWSRGLPAGTQESTPIVYRGVMYVMAPGASI